MNTLERLQQGLPPAEGDLLAELSVGIEPFSAHMDKYYFSEYIAAGGSKIKFVTGRPGSGKSHFLSYLTERAKKGGFETVHFSAMQVWLHDFKEIYAEIFNRCDLMACLQKCAGKIVQAMGYRPEDIPAGATFADYLSSRDEFDALNKKEIRNQLRTFFLKNPLIDNNFAVACSLLTGSILGHPTLESSAQDLLLAWLSGSSQVRLAEVRHLGLSPTRITKYNARHMLRSLLTVITLSGQPGLLVTIDDMDILTGRGALDVIRYTKMKREDAYECIRELIDEIDTLQHVMFFFAFDRRLIDDEIAGLKSYQALWLRVQNEIVSDMFNPFTDIIDLDNLGKRIYNQEVMMDMSKRLAQYVWQNQQHAAPIDHEKASTLLDADKHSAIALPRQVGKTTLETPGGEVNGF